MLADAARALWSLATMIHATELLKRQQVLADFGGFVIDCNDLQQILTEGCRLIAAALHVNLAKVLEIERDRGTALVRAGVGWNADIVGRVRIQLSERSSEAHAIRTGEPLITTNIATEDRFEFPRFMRDHGIVALVNVPILLPGREPYGVLQVDSREPREFGHEDIQFLRTYAMVLGPVIDRLQKAHDLAYTTEKYRIIVENARDYAIILTDERDRITDWLPGAAAVFGWTEKEAKGRPAEFLFTPEDRAIGIPEKEIDIARREGKAPNVRWHVRKDGARVFIDGQTTVLRTPDGVLNGFMKIGQDITERRRAQEELGSSEARLRLALEAARLGAWDWDMSTGKVDWSDEHYRLHGYEVGEVEPSYAAWMARIHPDDRETAEQTLKHSQEHHLPYMIEFRAVHPDGTLRWCSARGRFFYDDAGKPRRMIGVVQDVSERREWEGRQQMLVAELQHRTRNLIAVVRSLADKTARASKDLPDFRSQFRERLDALARVQTLLSGLGSNERVSFDELLRAQLDAINGQGQRVALEGPRGVKLRSSTVQILSLALHELATNAVKYGALSQPDASLKITWQLGPDDGGGARWLHIDWREADVVISPETRTLTGRGEGRELIERALPFQLGARTHYVLGPDGVHCTVSIPVTTSARGEDEA